ncbi:hypothetical protein, partial [Sinorhizobium meliloti]|uniref:hypothetical protein n=1 Tax=Rhizobium meliloti TaxID=382 RepID=UPI001AEC99E9
LLFVTHIWCPPILSGHFMRQRHQREKAHGNERLRYFDVLRTHPLEAECQLSSNFRATFSDT